MNHNNKIVDTPRTDAARHDEHDPYTAIASECSKLERELNAANARIKRLEEESESRWMLAQSAIGSCAEMSSIIKRLEEAGDAMMSEPCEYTFEQWIKAKEAKP